MPIIAGAKKALRQTKTRTERNRVVRANVRNIVKKSEKASEQSVVSQLFSTLDRAVKRHIIHKNKAARLKSRAVKLLSNNEVIKEKPKAKSVVKKIKKTVTKKTAKK
jgi:small subunit ribosomal protein S20